MEKLNCARIVLLHKICRYIWEQPISQNLIKLVPKTFLHSLLNGCHWCHSGQNCFIKKKTRIRRNWQFLVSAKVEVWRKIIFVQTFSILLFCWKLFWSCSSRRTWVWAFAVVVNGVVVVVAVVVLLLSSPLVGSSILEKRGKWYPYLVKENVIMVGHFQSQNFRILRSRVQIRVVAKVYIESCFIIATKPHTYVTWYRR